MTTPSAAPSFVRFRLLETPTGPFAIGETGGGGLRTTWVDGPGDARLMGAVEDPDFAPELVERVARYFAGDDVDFAFVALPRNAVHDPNAFASRCWTACRAIPRGETRTYGELARLAGAEAGAGMGMGPGSARAAGQAMRHNPLPIIVPCHRVVAAGGGLGGFGGSADPADRRLAVKRWLLEHENALPTGEDEAQGRFTFS